MTTMREFPIIRPIIQKCAVPLLSSLFKHNNIRRYETELCKTAHNRGIRRETNCILRLPYIAYSL